MKGIIIGTIMCSLFFSGCAGKTIPEVNNEETVVEVTNQIDEEKVDSIKEFGPTDLHVAANKGQLDKVKEILETNPDVDIRDSFGGTALHASMFQDNIEIVKLFIEAGFEVDAQGTGNGYTPLHDAVWANNLEAVKLLVENGADIEIKNKDGKTAMEKAENEGKTEIVEYFNSLK